MGFFGLPRPASGRRKSLSAPKLPALLLLLAVHFPSSLNAVELARTEGSVDVFRASVWTPASQGAKLEPGDQVRTGRGASCEVKFDDGTRLELGSLSIYVLQEALPSSFSMHLALGTLRAWVSRARERRFRVSTPTAVCAVRGTEFRATVSSGGNSIFDLYSGLLGVQDKGGNEKLLNPGQRLEVTPKGLGEIQPISKALEKKREQLRESLRSEVGLHMSKEQVMQAAAQEIRLAEYQAGKSLIDVFGNRVRLEQYILRPQPNQFKLVVLDQSSSGFNYFYYLGIFNQNLPINLSLALNELGGAPGTPPQWYETGYQTGRSNLTDTVIENASGGHLVNINLSPDPNEHVTQYFDSAINQYVTLPAGTPFWKPLFDNYSIAYNGIVFETWAGTNIQSMTTGPTAPTFMYIQDNGTLGALAPSLNNDAFPDFPLIHQKIKETFGSGTYWDQYDNYLIDDNGNVANVNQFNGVTSGTQYLQTLLQWNFEQVVTSSVFGGRSINLVVEPKTLIQSGLISQ